MKHFNLMWLFLIFTVGCANLGRVQLNDNVSYRDYSPELRIYAFEYFTPSELLLYSHIDPVSKGYIDGLHDVNEVETAILTGNKLIVCLKDSYEWDDYGMYMNNIILSRIAIDQMYGILGDYVELLNEDQLIEDPE